MGKPRVMATVQIDTDGLWTFQEYYRGGQVPATPDPIFMSSVPRFLDLFRRHGVRATFFFNGRDVLVEEKRLLMQRVLDEGHEIANHGMNHILGFASRSEAAKEEEIRTATEVLETHLGVRPAGYRVPGYDVDAATLRILERLGYAYDSSVFPIFYARLFKILDYLLSRKQVRRAHGPGPQYGFAPMRPYRPAPHAPWRRGSMRLVELPVTPLPLIRFPFHGSFALLGGANLALAGLRLCRWLGVPVNYVFHAMDLADPVEDPSFPPTRGTRVSLARKERLFGAVVGELASEFEVLTSKEMAARLGPALGLRPR